MAKPRCGPECCGCCTANLATKLDLERQKVEFAQLKTSFAELEANIAAADAEVAERETGLVWRLFLFAVGILGVIIGALAFIVPLLLND